MHDLPFRLDTIANKVDLRIGRRRRDRLNRSDVVGERGQRSLEVDCRPTSAARCPQRSAFDILSILHQARIISLAPIHERGITYIVAFGWTRLSDDDRAKRIVSAQIFSETTIAEEMISLPNR